MTTAPPSLGAPYRRLLSSSAISTLGDGIRFAALPLLSAALLDDPVRVAAVTAATTVPWLVLGLALGAVADRVDRVRMMVAADALRAGTLLVMAALLVTGSLGFAGLLVGAVLLGIGEVMFDCASFAVLPALVPAERLEAANGRLFTTQTIGRDLLGHLLGGLLYQAGRVVPLVVDTVSFAVSALLLRGLPAQPPPPRARTTLRADVLDGLRRIVSDRLLLALTAAGGVINAVYLGQIAILVLLVRDELGFGPVGYSVVLALGALGGVLGGLVAERVVARVGRLATLVGGLGLVGLSGVGASLGTVASVVAGYAALGLGLMLWNVVAVTLRQSIVPADMLGRTMGAYRLVAWGTMPVGALAAGAAAAAWGTRTAFAAGGVAVLVLGVALAPVLWRDGRVRGATGGGA